MPWFRRHRTVAVLTGLFLLSGCGGQPVTQPAAPPGQDSTGLGQPVTSLDQLAALVRDKTGSCTDAKPASKQEFAEFVGPRLVGLYEPYMAEWATCSLPQYPKLGLFLFKPDQQPAFEQSWKEAMASGRVSGNPSFSFGNGYAVTSGLLGVHELGLHYLSCGAGEVTGHSVPAHVDGCVFVNPEHHGH